MLLAIDVGNTNTVLGVVEAERLTAHFRLMTHPVRTADEYGIVVVSLLREAKVDPSKIDGVAISSVVPPLTPIFEDLAKTRLGRAPLVIEPGVRTGMPI